MNSRSQTKIRKMQQLNLLAEERYLKSKRLLKENLQGGIEDCLTNGGLEVPPECSPEYTPQDGSPGFDFAACATKLIDLYGDTDKATKVCGCISDNMPSETEETIKTMVKTACSGISNVLKTGTDIIKQLPFPKP